MIEQTPRQLVGRFVFVLFKRKWLFVSSFCCTLLVLIVILYMVEPKYKATARILVRSSTQKQLILFPDLETPKQINHQVKPAQNLVQISKSRTIAEKIVKKFDLHVPREPDNPRDHIKHGVKQCIQAAKNLLVLPGSAEDEQTNNLASAVEQLMEEDQDIQAHEDTEIVDLTIWNRDPDLASAIANAMAQLLVEETQEMTRIQSDATYRFAREQTKTAEKSLQEAEERLKNFKVRYAIHSLPEERQLILQRLDQLNQLRSETIAGLAEAEAKLAEVKQQHASQQPTVVSATVDAASPVIDEGKVSLNSLVARLASLRVDFSETNPRVMEMQAEIDELRRKLAAEPEMIPSSKTTVINPIHQELESQMVDLRSSVRAQVAKVEAWQDEIVSVERKINELTQNESMLDRLTREKETHRERFESLRSKMLELEILRLTASGDFDIRLFDPALVFANTSPDFPDWGVGLVMALFLASMTAFAVPFAVEYFDDRLDSPASVESRLSLPILATLPQAAERRRRFWR